ncbi:PAS protein [Lysobacter dokdonensis DS-58]|uniref:histidine kinase n=1 Tax=Lysobacter dokdonensis DS-58 TaxID=1300345 RepID=A0A0A2WGT8_9GAMM|nr:PAS domain S-box protein [Lysobacter dokdonensis]KGQ17922.1 PAS protein [Lysobacter dokdonensis DS-58]
MIDDPAPAMQNGRAEEPQAASRWVDIADRADVGMLRVDAGGHLVDINPAAARMLGRGIGALRGVAFESLGDVADRDAIQNALGALHAGKPPVTVAVQLARLDGTTFAAMARFTAVRDFTGVLRASTITLLAVDEDAVPTLTEPQRPREGFTPEVSYRALFDGIDQGFCVVEVVFDGNEPVDYRFIETNRAFERYTGLVGAVGKSMRDLAPSHESHWFEFYADVVRTQCSAQRTLPAEALGRWYAVHAFPFGPKDSRRVAALFEDISARVRSEQALRDSEERFRCLANASPSILWSATADGAMTWLSDRWNEYTGQGLDVTREERNSAIHPGDREVVATAWRRAFQGEEFDTELRLRRRDGAYRWFLVRANPAHDEAGKLTGWYGSTTDIHDRKMAEVALREVDQRKDEFLATLAHELRNPLAPLRNCLHILRMADHGEVGAHVDGERLRGVMERQVAQLVRLVDDLMEVSRITRGMVPMHLQSVSLADVVERAVETSRPLIDTAQHALSVSLPDAPLVLHADPVRLAQVLSNLLNNAAKYTDPGGRITLSARRDDNDAVIVVQDNGLGIATDQIARVFDLFSQAEHSIGHAAGGLGIGLTLVRSLVEMHGGSVIARSAGLGQGSEFEVRLPLAPDDVRAEPLDGATHAPSVKRMRLLVVDDNREHTDSLALFLRMQGHQVRTGYDAASALTWQVAFTPDAVLLDLGMPGVDGYEVCRRMRVAEGGDALVIVAITGWGQMEVRQRTAEAGFDAHVVKPVDPVALESLIDSLVRMKHRT